MKSLPESLVRAAAAPMWFGPAERPLFGWLHRPVSGRVRGLVVVCPSLGQEAVFSHYLLRSTADELATLGFVVVRFDYDGTGDSQGDEHDPDRVAAWLRSIEDAIALGREYTNAPLALFGFRIGALLAVAAADRSDEDVHGLVLWDAPRNGRQFLREQVMRQNVSVGRADFDSGAFTALGLSLTEATRADLTRLDLRRRRTLPADAVITIDRSGRPGLGTATDRRGGALDHVEASDQDELLSRQALPFETRREAIEWLCRTYSDESYRLAPHDPADNPQAGTVSHDGVRERVTSIGSHGLFGIVTEPEVPTATTTTVVFVPDSTTPHGGLSRIWTELARQWAGAGIRSLRFDLTGCADSPAHDGLPAATVGLLAHLDDTTDAMRHANPDNPSDTIVVGLCSGGYLTLESALALQPRGVAMINPVLSFITPEGTADPRRGAVILSRQLLHRLFGRVAGRLASRLARTNQTPAFTSDPNFAWNRAFEACFWQVYLHSVVPWLPDSVWRAVNALLTTTSVADIFRKVRAGGTEILLLAGDPDFDRFTLGSRRRLRAMARHGGIHLEHHDALDHAMMWPGAKREVQRSLSSFVLTLTGGTAMSDTATRVDLPPAPCHAADSLDAGVN